MSSATKSARGNNNGGSSSDMDIASNSDEEIFERHHSPQRSPQDYKIHVGLPHVYKMAAQNGIGRNGAKVFGADDLSDSATSTEVSYVLTFTPLLSRFPLALQKDYDTVPLKPYSHVLI